MVKIEESKRRARRESAALPFAAKLRIVERLRDEAIVKLDKLEWPRKKISSTAPAAEE